MQRSTTRRGRERAGNFKGEEKLPVKCGRKEEKKIPKHLFTKQERYHLHTAKALQAQSSAAAADGDSSMLCCDYLRFENPASVVVKVLSIYILFFGHVAS